MISKLPLHCTDDSLLTHLNFSLAIFDYKETSLPSSLIVLYFITKNSIPILLTSQLRLFLSHLFFSIAFLYPISMINCCNVVEILIQVLFIIYLFSLVYCTENYNWVTQKPLITIPTKAGPIYGTSVVIISSHSVFCYLFSSCYRLLAHDYHFYCWMIIAANFYSKIH